MRIKFLLILIVALSINCKENEKSSETKEHKFVKEKLDIPSIIELRKKSGNSTNIFYKDSTYIGVISYNGIFDSITTKIFNEDDYPMRRLFYYKSDVVAEDLIDKPEYFENKFTPTDTFYAAKHNKIPFEVSFNQAGTNYLNGIIEDIVYIKLKDSTKLRMISKYLIISTKVEVIEYKLEVPPKLKG